MMKPTNYSRKSFVPPRFTSQSIPILIDDVKQLDEFRMTRCTFFTINPISSVEDWISQLGLNSVPFLLFGITAVLYRPDKDTTRFLTSDAIDRLFHQIEEVEGLVVESEHVWIPNTLFKIDSRGQSSTFKDTYLKRGAVWRAKLRLFQVALIFQRELIDTAEYSRRCQLLEERSPTPLEFSPEETEAFQSWSTEQIAAAMDNYKRQRDDPKRRVLDWLDEQGNRRPG